LIIGRVLRPHGVRGEVRASVLSELPERFEWLKQVYLGQSPEAKKLRHVAVEGVRFHQDHVLLKLAGIDTRDDAEALRTLWLLVPESEGIPLEEGEFYLYQLENMAVFTESGEFLGRIVEILETKAHDVFVVHGDGGELLLPDTDEVVKSIDLEAGQMIVHLLSGLRP
jgi:16S rRNA processing protein RimM